MLRSAQTADRTLRRDRRSTRAAMAVLVVGMASVLGACAKAPTDAQLTDALTKSGIPKAEATCASKAISASLTEKQIEEIVERGSTGAPRDDTERTDDPLDKVRAALGVCRDEAAALTTSTTSPPVTVTTTTLPAGASTSSTVPPASSATSADGGASTTTVAGG